MKKEDIRLIKQENLRDEFFNTLLRLTYIADKNKRKALVKKAKLIADKIPELEGWPKKEKFWDAEAGSWIVKIPKYVRQFIRKQLLKKIKPGTLNLSLGSGPYPYIKDSVLMDYSEK
ncbi:hypothetical protein KY317_02695, partial [Candidatus Woesearchaeota archaeon]|nr:hypothetical protein [Candidatus Woesearchaeota archaeon]